MKIFFIRLCTMMLGLFLFSLGIVFTINANIGYSPWDVFHTGLVNTFGFTIGFFQILVGILVLIITTLLGEKIGMGTIFNIVFIGIFIDLLFFIDIIPVLNNFLAGVFILVVGLFLISIGSYFYIKSGFGAGPRDSLMVVLARKTKIRIGICRSTIEFIVTILGWFLGGMVGLGTVISVVGIGFCIQITFKLLRFDVTQVKHETILDTISLLSGKRQEKH